MMKRHSYLFPTWSKSFGYLRVLYRHSVHNSQVIYKQACTGYKNDIHSNINTALEWIEKIGNKSICIQSLFYNMFIFYCLEFFMGYM